MKKILTILMASILAVVSVFAVGCAELNSENSGTANNYLRVHGVCMAMGAPMSATLPNGTKYIEKTLTATVLPTTASNREVDYTVKWDKYAERINEPVSDYLTVVPTSDGGTVAKVRCYKDFGNDKIIITVKTRDGGFTDTCTCTFQGLFRDFRIEVDDDIPLKNSAGIGDYYQLRNGETYVFDLKSTDIYNDEVPGEYSLTCTGWGLLWMEMDAYYQNGAWAKGYAIRINFGNKEIYKNNDIFYSAYINENNQLVIETPSDYLLNGNDISYNPGAESTTDYTFTITQPKEDGYELEVYNKTDLSLPEMITDEELKQLQQETLISNPPHFIVEIYDAVSGKTVPFKFWIESGCEDVQFDNNNLVFSTR